MRAFRAKEWRPLSLHLALLFGYLATAVAFLVTIPVLFAISSRDNGLVSVSDKFSGLGIEWKLSLAWTALPSLSMTLLGAWWTSIADAIAFRQPFVELNEPGPATSTASRTIMLDYRSTPSLWRWWKAFKLRHILVGLTCLSSLVLGKLAPPLTAALLVPRSTQLSRSVTTKQTKAFESTISDTDMRTVLDLVSATKLHNASRIPWTSDEFAFTPLDVQGYGPGLGQSIDDVRLTTPATGHAAYLECEILVADSDYELDITRQESDSKGVTKGSLHFNALDRGCGFRYDLSVSDIGDTTFLDIRNFDTCSAEAYRDRIVFTYGVSTRNAATLLEDITVVSCISGYFTSEGTLTVLLPGNSSSVNSPTYLGFEFDPSLKEPVDSLLAGEHTFETVVFLIGTVDGDLQWKSTEFGNLVLFNGGLLMNGTGSDVNTRQAIRLSPEILRSSIREMFSYMYAVTAALYGFPDDTDGVVLETAEATLEYTVTRLFVVPWIAAVLMAVLASVVALSVCVIVHVMTTTTLLREEPAGLLSMAGIIQGGDLAQMADQVRTDERYSGVFVADCKSKGLDPEARWRMKVSNSDDTRPILTMVKSPDSD